MNYYLGVDPGKHGGFAFIDADTGSPNAFSWDDAAFTNHLIDLVKEGHTVKRACVEKVSAMPGQGVTSMFRFGQSFGFILGVLEALRIPFQLVPPKTWKKEFSLDNDKQKSIEACQRLFPNVNLVPPRCRKPHDGIAESLLLAEYAKRHF